MAEKEYIEREAAYPLAKKICDAIDSEDFQRLNFGMRILDWIDDIPAADVRPVVKSKWVKMKFFPDWECEKCGSVISGNTPDPWNHYHFCPNCGAVMEGSR